MRKILFLLFSFALLSLIIKYDYAKTFLPASREEAKKIQEADLKNLEGNFIEKALSKILINVLKTEEGRTFFENLVKPEPKNSEREFLKYPGKENSLAKILKIKKSGEGWGGQALCGHRVEVFYTIKNLKGRIVEEGEKTFAPGDRSVIPGLAFSVIGMKKGQKARAILPPKYAYGEPEYRRKGIAAGENYLLEVELKKISPDIFLEEGETKIFDETGLDFYEKPAFCGDKIAISLKITNLSNGKILSEEKNLSLKIGDPNLPIILSHALHDRPINQKRTLLAKGISLGSLYSKNKIGGNFSEKDYILIEIEPGAEIKQGF